MAEISNEMIDKISVDAQNGRINRELLRTLRKGHKAMRAKSTADNTTSYLPIEKNESTEEHSHRVKYKTSLNGSTKKTIEDVNNSIFSKPVNFITKDKDLKDIEQNFNGMGSTLTEWAGNFNKNGMWNGVYFALVNFNTATALENPYVVDIDVDQVEEMRRNDKGEIVFFKYHVEEIEYLNDFESENVAYKYIYKLVDNRVIIRTFRKSENESDYIELEQKALPEQINVMPIVDYYPDSAIKTLDPELPYEDIADKNLSHWIYKSIHINLADVSSRPFIFGTGFKQKTADGKDNKIPFGVKVMYTTDREGAKITWVQADPKSADIIKSLLADFEKDMEVMGSEFLTTTAKMTATEVIASTADTTARASKFANNLEKALERIVDIMLLWKRKPNVEYVLNVNKNVGITKDKETYDVINQLNTQGLISDKHARLIYKGLDYLPQDIDEEEYVEELENEGKSFTGGFDTIPEETTEETEESDNDEDIIEE